MFRLYTGGPILITPGWRKGKMQKVSRGSKKAELICSLGSIGWPVSQVFLEKIRVAVPGASKVDHFQQVEPFLFRIISKCFFFIVEGQFLLLQSANCGKREFSQLSVLFPRSCINVSNPEMGKDHWSFRSRSRSLNWSRSFVWTRSLQGIFSYWSWSWSSGLMIFPNWSWSWSLSAIF